MELNWIERIKKAKRKDVIHTSEVIFTHHWKIDD